MSSGKSNEVTEQVEEPIKEFEVASNATQATTSQPEQITAKSGESVQQIQQPTVIEVKLPQELIERMNQLDQEIINLRKEVVSLNDNFKSLILEFKESMAELSSPFNMLRSSRNKNGNGKNGSEGRKVHSALTPTSFLEVLKVIYSMLGRIGTEQALKLIDGYVKVGLISDEVGKALSVVVELADSMRKSGLTLEDQLPYLYGIISALNIRDNLLSDYVLKELMKHGEDS